MSDVLRADDRTSYDRKTLCAAVVGLVGDQRGIAFLPSLKQIDRPLTADKILGSYGRNRAVVIRWISKGRTDLLENTLLAVKKYIQPKADFAQVRSDPKRWGTWVRSSAICRAICASRRSSGSRTAITTFPSRLRRRQRSHDIVQLHRIAAGRR